MCGIDPFRFWYSLRSNVVRCGPFMLEAAPLSGLLMLEMAVVVLLLALRLLGGVAGVTTNTCCWEACWSLIVMAADICICMLRNNA